MSVKESDTSEEYAMCLEADSEIEEQEIHDGPHMRQLDCNEACVGLWPEDDE
jgi:hypothetical protein